MNYDKTHKILSKLTRILFKIESKQEQIEGSNKFNQKNTYPELEIDVQEIIDERKNLEFEFKELTLTLRQ